MQQPQQKRHKLLTIAKPNKQNAGVLCLFIINAICNYLFGWRDCQHASTVCIWSVYIYTFPFQVPISSVCRLVYLFACHSHKTQLSRTKNKAECRKSAPLTPPIYIYTIYTHDPNQDPKSPEPQKARECRREFWKSCKSCRQHRSISHFRICVAIINLFCTLATDFVY